jgi:plasmid maintenance system antidote protein VapI
MIEQYVSQYSSKAEFCRAIGIKHRQFLQQIMTGKRPIPPSVAIKLYEIHGVDLHSIRPDIYPKNCF